MARIYGITQVAAFESITTDANLQRMLQDLNKQLHDMRIKGDFKYLEVTSDKGEIIFQSGDQHFKPEVWSHRPFIVGMPVRAIVEQFETKHVCCLGDESTVIDVRTIGGKYQNKTVLACWMVYVELAIEHYNTPF